MDLRGRGSGGPLRLAHPGRGRDLQRKYPAAAVVSAQYRFSCCLEYLIPFDGDQRSADRSVPGISDPYTKSAAVCRTAGIQFLLEHHFFQLSKLWLCLALAGGALGIDPLDDRVLLQNGPTGCMAADTVFPVGGFCGLFEPWRMAPESIKISRSKEIQKSHCFLEKTVAFLVRPDGFASPPSGP